MTRELWLEFGRIEREQNNFQHTYWYNEGRWQELPYWLKDLFKNLFNRKMYHLIRYGKLEFVF